MHLVQVMHLHRPVSVTVWPAEQKAEAPEHLSHSRSIAAGKYEDVPPIWIIIVVLDPTCFP